MTDCKYKAHRIIYYSKNKEDEYNEIRDYGTIYSTLNKHIANDLAKICMDYILFNINKQQLYNKYHPRCVRIECEKLNNFQFKLRTNCYRKYVSTLNSYCSCIVLDPNDIVSKKIYMGTKYLTEFIINDSIYCLITKCKNIGGVFTTLNTRYV